MVNSYHHQSIKAGAPGFTVTARAADGIIEAYEAPLVWGFQFHPERLVKEDDTWLKLFKAYLSILPGTYTF